MVRSNFLNILEDIEQLSNIELAVFTTFSFDVVFFENVILRRLRDNNPGILIIVLIDADHYPVVEEFSDSTGTQYLLLPISKTLFHPKLFLFLSKEKRLAYIGSHNLTLNGITHNLELTLKTEDPSLINAAIDFLGSVIKKNVDDSFIESITKYKNSVSIKPKQNPDLFLISNLNRPILSQVLDIIADSACETIEVLVFAPFFSNVKTLLEAIAKRTKTSKISVCIQRNNHNLNVNQLSGLAFVSTKEVCQKEDRRIHSKFLVFKGSSTFDLTGSPNFTDPALNQIAEPGNIELAILRRQTKIEKIFDELKFKEISSEEVNASKRKDLPLNKLGKGYLLTVLMAEIDWFGQLIITTEMKEDQKILTLIVDQPSGKTSINLLVKKVENRVTVRPEIKGPLTIWFEEGGQRVSNVIRAYNPSEAVSVLSKKQADVHLIPSLIASSKDLESLLRIIAAILPDERHERKPSQSSQSGPSPGRFIERGENESIFDILLDLLSAPRILQPKGKRKENTAVQPKTNVTSESEDQADELENEQPEPEEQRREAAVAELFEKWVLAFGNRRLSKDTSPANYTAYILISLKMIEILVKDEDKDDYLEYVLNSLSNLIDRYGLSSRKEETALLLSLVLYLECEVVESVNSVEYLKILNRIVNESAEMEKLLFSSDDPLIGLKFKDYLNRSLNNAEFTHSLENNYRLNRIIASMVATIILKKKEQYQAGVLKNLVAQIRTLKDDDCAFYISLILQKLIESIPDIGENKAEIEYQANNTGLRSFRQTLYQDVVKKLNQFGK